MTPVPSPLPTVRLSRNSLATVIMLLEELSGKNRGPVHDNNSVGNPKNYKEVMCSDCYISSGSLKLHDSNNKFEIASHQILEPDPHRYLPVDDKCATLKLSFHTLFVYRIKLVDISHGRTVTFSQKTCHQPFRPRKTIRLLLCDFYSQLRYGAN